MTGSNSSSLLIVCTQSIFGGQSLHGKLSDTGHVPPHMDILTHSLRNCFTTVVDPNKPRVPSAPFPLPLSARRENTSHIPKGISTQGGGPNSPILSRSRLELRSIRFECSPTLLFTFNIELHEKKRKNGLQNNALTAFVRSDWDFLGFLRGGDFQ